MREERAWPLALCQPQGVPELPWYAELREAHRPERVRVLLIGESAPDPGAAERRFFYAPVLDRRDNLYRGVVEAFYGCFPGRAGDPKATWLNRLEGDGVFLIDLVPFPVNGLSPDKAEARRLRASARRNHVAACVEHARHLDPEVDVQGCRGRRQDSCPVQGILRACGVMRQRRFMRRGPRRCGS